jgi:hypothetical protein
MGVFLEMRPLVSIAHRLGGNTTIPLADIGRAAETLAGLSESALAAFACGFPADANVLLVLCCIALFAEAGCAEGLSFLQT